MQIRLQECTVVQRRIADCFRYLKDFSTIEQWDPGVYRAVKTTPGRPEVGSRFDLVLNVRGRRVPMRYEIAELEENRRLSLRGSAEAFQAVDTIDLRPIGDTETEILYTADLTFGGLPGLAALPLGPYLRRVGRRAVRGLHSALSVPDRPPPLGLCKQVGDRLIVPGAWDFTERGYLRMPRKGLSEFVDGRLFVITGPTSGIGLAAACELSRLGAALVLVGRGASRLEEARQRIMNFSGASAARIDIVEADLSLVDETGRAADAIARRYEAIDGLINNAGALFNERGDTPEGHERALAVNLLAPYVLTRSLLPGLERGRGRVINVASGGMYLQPLHVDNLQSRRGRYDGAAAYARAKRALTALTEYWSERLGAATGVTFNSMHPGWAATPGVEKSLPLFNRKMHRYLRDARMGADTIVWLATASEVEGESGKFWFDRRPHPTDVVPGTGVSGEKRARLIEWLEENTHSPTLQSPRSHAARQA